jgi:lactam utilization protein B
MASDSIWYGEDNDCSVKALARLSGISYNQAHAYCKANGREDKEAMSLREFLDAVRATGADILGFNLGESHEAVTKNQKMTVKQASKAFADRYGQNFILMTKDHIIAVCDGEMEESEVRDHSRKKVQVSCEIMHPDEASAIKEKFDRWGEYYGESECNMPHEVYWEVT